MKTTTQYIVVFVTARDAAEARAISKGLLESKLIACANIIGGVQSLFWWQGKIDEASEVLLVMKTKKALFKKLIAKVRALHSYDTPEVIALPVMAGSTDYLKWIDDSVRKGT